MGDPQVVSQHVTGDWSHIWGREVLRPDGLAVFTPIPGAYGPLRAVTVGEVRALVTRGRLVDLQGRDGVWLAAVVDGLPVRWRARVVSLVAGGSALEFAPVEFDPDPDGVIVTALEGAI